MTSGFSLIADVDNYCVMGNPIAHSKSPQIHKIFAEQTHQVLHYQAVLVETEFFHNALSEFQRQGGKGLNITVPFKADACSAVKHLSARAEITAAVNTIWFEENGESYGDTTDGIGLVNDLSANDIQLKDKRILILGAGGAVSGVLGSLVEQGVDSITTANRTHARAETLVKRQPVRGLIRACEYRDLEGQSFDLIINGTSASLESELPPIPSSIVENSCCYDMVYADVDTVFIEWARENGASRAMDGLGMLVYQAAESFYIWRGVRPDSTAVIEVLRNKF